jgi:hypothetical protein
MRRALLHALVFAGIFATTLSPAFASQCTATKVCGGGTPVQCQGTTSCQALSNGVECDGIPTSCSSPSNGDCYMEYYCPNGFIFFCSGTNSCSTNTTSQTISCDQTGPNSYPGGVYNSSTGLTTYSCSYCDSHPNECDAAGGW